MRDNCNLSDYKKFYNVLKQFKPEPVTFIIWKDEYYNIKRKYYLIESIKEEEFWKEIGKTKYLVSSRGRVMNKITKSILKPKNHKFGQQIVLCHNGKQKTYTISRLVANYFIRPLKDNEIAVHINDDILNNYYKNLKIVRRTYER